MKYSSACDADAASEASPQAVGSDSDAGGALASEHASKADAGMQHTMPTLQRQDTVTRQESAVRSAVSKRMETPPWLIDPRKSKVMPYWDVLGGGQLASLHHLLAVHPMVLPCSHHMLAIPHVYDV